ncbi:uncharacterized protein LOC144457592 [Phascolarctos cinereus]
MNTSPLHDNSSIITITITKLRLTVKDSGVCECVILEESPKTVPEEFPKSEKAILRRFHLVVSSVETQSPTKGIQTTTEVISNNPATNNRPGTLSILPPDESSSEKKLSILGVVLSCLLLLVLLVVGIICTRRIYQKARKELCNEDGQ